MTITRRLLSVAAFSTLATGFWIGKLGLNPGPSDRLIYHNCTPRQDDPEARRDNEGEGLTYALLANGGMAIRNGLLPQMRR